MARDNILFQLPFKGDSGIHIEFSLCFRQNITYKEEKSSQFIEVIINYCFPCFSSTYIYLLIF